MAGCTLDRAPSSHVAVQLDLKALQSATAAKPGVISQKPTLEAFKCLILRARGQGIQTPGSPGKNCDPMQWGLFTAPQANPLFGQSPGGANATSEVSFQLPVNEGDDRVVDLVGYNPHDGGACATWSQRILPNRRDEFLRDAYVLATSGRIQVRASRTIELESAYDPSNGAQPRVCGPYVVPQSGTALPRRIAQAAATTVNANFYCSTDNETVTVSFNGTSVGSANCVSGSANVQGSVAASIPANDGVYAWQLQHGPLTLPLPLLVDRTPPASNMPQPQNGPANPFVGSITGLGPGISFGVKFEDINGVMLTSAAQVAVSTAINNGQDPSVALGNQFIEITNAGGTGHGCSLKLTHLAGGPGSNNPNMMGFRGTATNCTAAAGTQFAVTLKADLVKDIGPDPTISTTNAAVAIKTSAQPFVIPGNTAPTLSGFTNLSGTEDTPLTITHAMLVSAAQGLGDSETPTAILSFMITGVNGTNGTLTKSGSGVTVNSTTIGPNESVVWTPALNNNGTLNAFSVKAYDGALASDTARQLNIVVNPVNDPPQFSVTQGNTYTFQLGTTPSLNLTNIRPGPTTATDEASQTVSLSVSGGGALLTTTLGSIINGSANLTLAGLVTGNTNLTLAATDNGSPPNASAPFSIAVTVTAGAPTLSYPQSTQNGTVNTAMSISPTTLQHNGYSINSCQIKAGTTALPSGLSVNASTCVISGTPTTSSAATTYTVVAANSAGTSADATVKISVGSGANNGNAGAGKTWTGQTSTAWSTSTNWSPNGVPGSNDDVTIPGSATAPNQPSLTGDVNGTAKAKSIALQNDSSLTIAGSSYSFALAPTISVAANSTAKLIVSGYGIINIPSAPATIEINGNSKLLISKSTPSSGACSATSNTVTVSLASGGKFSFRNGLASNPVTPSNILVTDRCITLSLDSGKIEADTVDPDKVGISGIGALEIKGSTNEIAGALPVVVTLKQPTGGATNTVTLKGNVSNLYDETFTDVSANWDASTPRTCAITAAGSLRCWGENGLGRLGDGTSTLRWSPVVIDPGVSYSKVSVGSLHACGITSNNKLKCWGNGANGMLGLGSVTTSTNTPTQVGTGDYQQVSARGLHTCAITGTSGGGALQCWGRNTERQLGLGSSVTADQSTPQTVNSGTSYIAVAIGYYHTCAITSNNVLHCWGDAGLGRLGNNSSSGTFDTPQTIDSGTGYKKVSVGLGHTCGITTSDMLKCWGNGANGKLGNNSTSGAHTPVVVNSGTSYSQVSAGENVTCGITLSTQELQCWGKAQENLSLSVTETVTSIAQTATGSMTLYLLGMYKSFDQTTPAAVSSAQGSSSSSVSMGSNHGCVISSVGKLFCWGAGNKGQLGMGEGVRWLNAPRRVPAGIGLLTLESSTQIAMDSYNLTLFGNVDAKASSTITANSGTTLSFEGGPGSSVALNGTLTAPAVDFKADQLLLGATFSNGNGSTSAFTAFVPTSAGRARVLPSTSPGTYTLDIAHGQRIYSYLATNATKPANLDLLGLSSTAGTNATMIWYKENTSTTPAPAATISTVSTKGGSRTSYVPTYSAAPPSGP